MKIYINCNTFWTTFGGQLVFQSINYRKILTSSYFIYIYNRLLQGSGSRLPSRVPRIFVTDEGRRALQEGLANLKSCGARIKGGLQRMDTTASSSAKEIIINIHRDLDFMESEVRMGIPSNIEWAIESYYWIRSFLVYRLQLFMSRLKDIPSNGGDERQLTNLRSLSWDLPSLPVSYL